MPGRRSPANPPGSPWRMAQNTSHPWGALGLLPDTGSTSLLALTQLPGASIAKSGMLHTDLVIAQSGMLHKKSQPLLRNIPSLLPARPRFGCWAKQAHRLVLFWQSEDLGKFWHKENPVLSSSTCLTFHNQPHSWTLLHCALRAFTTRKGEMNEGLELCDIWGGKILFKWLNWTRNKAQQRGSAKTLTALQSQLHLHLCQARTVTQPGCTDCF